jgi:hypothetical protein
MENTLTKDNIFEEGNEKNEMQRHLFIDQETRRDVTLGLGTIWAWA